MASILTLTYDGEPIDVVPSRVLVVDDDAATRLLLTRALSKSVEVVACASAEEALKLVCDPQGTAFGAVLTDKNLPNMDGVEFIRVVRKHQPYAACMMITAFVTAESVIEVMRLGATDYLEKPFADIDLVAPRVQKAIATQRVAYERDQLHHAVVKVRSELEARDLSLTMRQSDLEILDHVLHQRVLLATKDIQHQLEDLTRQSASHPQEPFLAVVIRDVLALMHSEQVGEAAWRRVIDRLNRGLELCFHPHGPVSEAVKESRDTEF